MTQTLDDDTANIRQLADELIARLLAANPFDATMLGLREHDAEVPDDSPEADAALRADLAVILARAASTQAMSPADRVTAAVIESNCRSALLGLDSAAIEYTASPLPFLSGPPVLFAVAARTVLSDASAAQDYLTRLRRSGAWLDGVTDRLRVGTAHGRTAVAALTAQAVSWADAALAEDLPAALVPAAPVEWDGAAAWQSELHDVVTEVVRPAVTRWRELLSEELLPAARSDEHCGLCWLPGGDADYLRAIEVHTTLPLTAEELHDTGVTTIERLELRAVELGRQLGLADLPAISAAVRAAAVGVDPDAAMEQARDAVRRAEAVVGTLVPAPLPPPCEIEPMPVTVADAGMPPHYTPPRLDGTRPGTYWFNTRRSTAGTSWDLEAVAFHEAVPGHHLQLARVQALTDLPALQTQSIVTVHAEGWGLYAEKLAGEIGLYSDVRQEIGSVYAELFRAARLVVDTGLHAFGWSRQRAVDYLLAHVAMPPDFLASEVDRYIAWPGQALAYLTGQREILRLRAGARDALGSAFDLAQFNATVLDSGSVSMPALASIVEDWVARSL